MRRFCSLVFICSFIFSYVNAQEVFSCGGFVRSGVSIDFSKVKIKLVTPEGNLKYETECAPNNGYYMIPVYSRGKYVVRVTPPNGWQFEPESLDLTVNGLDDPCTKGEDLNFKFTGFSVIGKVLNTDGNAASKGIQVTLSKKGTKGDQQNAETTEHGIYTFRSVYPGDYVITCGRDSQTGLCMEKGELSVKVAKDRVEVESQFRISGFRLSGTVLNNGHGVADVNCLLYTGESVKVKSSNCDTSPMPGFEPPEALKSAGAKFLCRVKSSAHGKFVFPCVPTAEYSLMPYYATVGTKYDVVPKVLKVKMEQESVVLREPFQVKGFSVIGSVLWKEKGAGVEGAEIFLAGKSVGKTDNSGNFLLEQVESGKYEIVVKKQDVEFPVVTVEVSPKKHRVDPIVVSKFQLCGKVDIKNFPDSVGKLTQRKLLVTNAKSKDDVVSVTTDNEGKFCRMIPRGKYVVEPQILPIEKQAGLSLLPPSKEVILEDKPVFDLVFSQFQASISGHVQCSVPCKKVVLHLLQGGQRIDELSLNPKQQIQQFRFSELLPGNFQVKLLGEHYCWEKNVEKVIVVDKDVTDVGFRQTGFKILVNTDSGAKLSWNFVGNKVVHGTEELKRGVNRFCLPVDGDYELKLESCHRFTKEVYKYSTQQADNTITLTANKHLVSGVLTMKEVTNDIVLEIRSNIKAEPIAVVGPLIGRRKNNESKTVIYEYQHYAGSNENLILTPVSKVFLFEPAHAAVSVTDDCIFDGPDFVGEKGIFLIGQISPPLEGVKVTLVRPAKTGMQRFETVSDEKGSYSVGPLRSFDGFEYSAEKEGYVLTTIEATPGHFRAMKLSELTITGVDLEGDPLTGVLVSVSGGVNFRSNNLTKDSGELNFVGLSPGEYFIRPVLKEYSFEPATVMVTVEEGSAESVKLTGTRVAFSVFGKVRHLAGQPVPSTTVEAVSEDCNQLQEEDTTTEEGGYRIRGLNPGCTYQLRLKSDPELSGTIPRQFLIQVSDKDVTERDFVLKPQITTMELTGRIITEQEFLPSLRVVIAREDQPDIPTQTVQMQYAGSFFMHNIPIDNAVYIVRIESSLSKTQFKHVSLPWTTFRANSSLHFVKFEFNPRKKSVEADISNSGYIVLPLVIISGLMVYNQAKVLPVLQENYYRLKSSIF